MFYVIIAPLNVSADSVCNETRKSDKILVITCYLNSRVNGV